MRMLTALIVLCVAAAPALAADPKPLRESSPTARQEMERFGTCVADRSPEKAAQTLAMDFRTPTYQSAMRNLTRANEDCFRRYRDAMRANNLSFAGAMAERLIERDATPINVRIARTAHVPVPPRTPSDAIAICIVRSAPDEVGKFSRPMWPATASRLRSRGWSSSPTFARRASRSLKPRSRGCAPCWRPPRFA